ncbi:carbohydrate ABC transporter permease [Bacillus sp. IITD106]|nr:carbohydrate ABC transporter permease [Bacillus sp. IITD106]
MSRKKWISKCIVYLLLIVGSVASMLPFYWLIRSSLMSTSQIFELPPVWIPSPFKLTNYGEALTILPFGRYFTNSAIIVLLTVTGTMISASLTAYGFSRLRWPGRNLIFGILLTGMMLPYAVTLIPTFIGWSFIGAIDTYFPLIVPAWFGGSGALGSGAFYIFLLRQFYLTLPRSLDEAAYIDGASYFRVYWQIILPLTKPAIIVVGLFSFMSNWNDFLGPLVYLNSDEKFTVALGLAQFQGLYTAQWELLMAAAVVVSLPALILFFIGQRYFIEGVALTGVKE